MIPNFDKTKLMLYNCSKNIFNEESVLCNGKHLTVSYSEKLLGVIFEPNLKFNDQLDYLSKNLRTVIYRFRILRNSISIKAQISIYHSLFMSLVRYSLMYFTVGTHIISIFKIQKKIIRTIFNLPKNTSCKNLFSEKRLLTVPSLYIFQVCLYVYTHSSDFPKQSDVHHHNTRNKNKLSTISNESSTTHNSFLNTGIKLFNKIPDEIKKISTVNSFKHHLQEYLLDRCIYDIDEL